MSKHDLNGWNTTPLVLNVMATVARRLDLDIDDDPTADILYELCSDLETFPPEEGFGSSDHYPYVEMARDRFLIEVQ